MKKSFILMTNAKRLTSLQLDTKLPRVHPRSLVTVAPFLTLPSSPILHHRFSLTAPLLSSLNSRSMEELRQDVRDRFSEGGAKETCDYKSSKRDSDHIIPHILNLYASQATAKDFEIYAPHATFEDPLMRAQGVQQIKSAFYSLAKVFSESRIVDYSIEENVISPGKIEILIDNKQYYKFLGRDINMISLIKLYTEDGKVVLHEDWWDKKPLWNRETVKMPLVGHIIEATRRASMMTTHALMRFGKDPST